MPTTEPPDVGGICLYWKHADVITVHTSMVEFIHDYQDVIDNRGLEVWWQDDAVTLTQTRANRERYGYATYAQQNQE